MFHLCNGESDLTDSTYLALFQFHHRDPGMIGVLGAVDLPVPENPLRHPAASNTSPYRNKPDPRPFYGLIVDGVHVHPNSVRIAYYAHPKGCVLVTDALSALGLPRGVYSLGGRDVEVDDNGAAYIKGTNTLAGRYVYLPRVEIAERRGGRGYVKTWRF